MTFSDLKACKGSMQRLNEFGSAWLLLGCSLSSQV